MTPLIGDLERKHHRCRRPIGPAPVPVANLCVQKIGFLAGEIPCSCAKIPSFAKKFPVPKRREFGCKRLNFAHQLSAKISPV
jgi:hypothetical protein